MKKEPKLMIIAMIVLLAVSIMPVQAWTDLGTYEKTTAWNGNDEPLYQSSLRIKNITAFAVNGVSRVSMIAPVSYYPTYTGNIDWSGNCTAGTATMHCSLTADTSMIHYLDSENSHEVTFEWTFDDISLNGATGTQDIAYVGGMPSGNGNLIGWRKMPQDYAWTTSNEAEILFWVVQNSEFLGHQHTTVYSGSNIIVPESSFSCTPTSQYPDQDVVCTDTSSNTPTSWSWSIDAEAMGIEGWQTHTGQNFTWQSHYPGLYSVNLQATNTAGSDWENKTNYVSIAANVTPNNCDIEPLTGYIRTYAQTNDGMTSGGIYNSDIQMKDMEGGAWSNVTNSGGWWCIDTLPGHSLNLYAQATGYTSIESLGVPANGGRHYLVMWPDYIPAASAGNITLYALVYDQQTGAPLYLSSVRVDGNTINTVAKNTGPEGQAMFTIKNDTSIHVTASKTGYSTITKVMTTSHFGPDTIMISLPRTSITATATATPTPSWMTPVTTLDSRSSSEKDAAMMDKIRNAGPDLIDLAILVTFMSLVGLIWKGFGK